MIMDDVLTLLASEKTQDIYGVWRETLTEQEVFCRVYSVTRSEFYNAGRNGLNPEYRFEIFQGDYNGETLCEYRGKSYSIYRTYGDPGEDYIELYVERKGGSNGAKQES